ncbi:MAG: DUF92 domain-containing protein [Ruminococcus sp.]|nr:DUF92 domain-containing protein [Ruminococcus sp.]
MKHLILSIVLSLLLALLALYKKAMTKSALLLACLFSIIITYYGGVSCFLILALTFILSSIANHIKSNERTKLTKDINTKIHKKDIFQIIANVCLGTTSIIIYALTNKNIYIAVYASIMAESLADTLASDIGVLSKKEPFNILTFQKSKPGLSGNISILGLTASLIGSIFIATIYLIFNTNLTHFFIIIISGFLGALFDSFLGATIQVKYKCPKCHNLTEKPNHCKTNTTYYKGLKIFNNDLVNFTSNLFSALLSILLLSTI